MEDWKEDNIHLILFTVLIGMLCAILVIVFAMYIFYTKTLASISKIRGVVGLSNTDQETESQDIPARPIYEKSYALNSDRYMDMRSHSFSFTPGRSGHSYPKRLGTK